MCDDFYLEGVWLWRINGGYSQEMIWFDWKVWKSEYAEATHLSDWRVKVEQIHLIANKMK